MAKLKTCRIVSKQDISTLMIIGQISVLFAKFFGFLTFRSQCRSLACLLLIKFKLIILLFLSLLGNFIKYFSLELYSFFCFVGTQFIFVFPAFMVFGIPRIIRSISAIIAKSFDSLNFAVNLGFWHDC